MSPHSLVASTAISHSHAIKLFGLSATFPFQSSSCHDLTFIACFPARALLPQTASAAQNPQPLCKPHVNAHLPPRIRLSSANTLKQPPPRLTGAQNLLNSLSAPTIDLLRQCFNAAGAKSLVARRAAILKMPDWAEDVPPQDATRSKAHHWLASDLTLNLCLLLERKMRLAPRGQQSRSLNQ